MNSKNSNTILQLVADIAKIPDLSDDDPQMNTLVKKLKSAKYRKSPDFPANNIELFSKFPQIGKILEGINDIYKCEQCNKYFLFVKGQRTMPFCSMDCLGEYHANTMSVEDLDYIRKTQCKPLKKKQ